MPRHFNSPVYKYIISGGHHNIHSAYFLFLGRSYGSNHMADTHISYVLQLPPTFLPQGFLQRGETCHLICRHSQKEGSADNTESLPYRFHICQRLQSREMVSLEYSLLLLLSSFPFIPHLSPIDSASLENTSLYTHM